MDYRKILLALSVFLLTVNIALAQQAAKGKPFQQLDDQLGEQLDNLTEQVDNLTQEVDEQQDSIASIIQELIDQGVRVEAMGLAVQDSLSQLSNAMSLMAQISKEMDELRRQAMNMSLRMESSDQILNNLSQVYVDKKTHETSLAGLGNMITDSISKLQALLTTRLDAVSQALWQQDTKIADLQLKLDMANARIHALNSALDGAVVKTSAGERFLVVDEFGVLQFTELNATGADFSIILNP